MEQKKTRLLLLGLGFWCILTNLNQMQWKGDGKSFLVDMAVKAMTPICMYMQKETGENGLAPLFSFVETQRDISCCVESYVPRMTIQSSWLYEDDSIPWSVEEEEVAEIPIEVALPDSHEAEKKAVELSFEQLQNPEYVRSHFFTVDETTQLPTELLGFDNLVKKDMSVTNKTPTILVYHTHSQEGFIDSVTGNDATTIVGAGEYLSKLLESEYGFHVIHHVAYYDLESRDYAYSLAADDVEKVLQEHPEIDVIIDLHRDAVKEGTRLVTQINGKTMAKFMFFNGMSYTKERGKLDSLSNPYIQDNLAFSFQLKMMAEEYYPGLTRKSYIKGYRYNMQYRPRSLLIELGGQTNTFEEACNSCVLIARMIASVLLGEYPEDYRQ